MEKIGVYIHIPFCKKKCLYCDFVSFNMEQDFQKKYIEMLKKEIKYWFCENPNYDIETIYIGGGTPSYINELYIEDILKILNPKKDISITIEVNPGTVNEKKLAKYKEIGINRLSIGLQSADDEQLKSIGRIHTYEDFFRTYELSRNLGFDNINIDLMIGLPKQTIKQIKNTLDKIIKLRPEHISVYSLILEENTPLSNLVKQNILNLPKEEMERNMYWYVKNYLEFNKYNHYEISNFALLNYEAKHNIDCWKQKQYIGFGLAAASYINNKRFCNISDINKYIKNISENNFAKNVEILEVQNKNDMMKEYMLLGLRMINGVVISEFESKFNENPIMIFKKELNKLVNEGLIIIDGNIIKLSKRGLDLANLVWEQFI